MTSIQETLTPMFPWLRSLGLLLLSAARLLAAEAEPTAWRNWPAWRGPLATGEAPLADPPLVWSESYHVRWKVPLPGEGSGTPIVWEDRVFITAAVPTDRPADRPPVPDETAKTAPPANVYRFVVLCFDRATGRLLWERVAREGVPREGKHDTNTYASASPLTDGQRLYVSFGTQGLYCYDLEGTLLWECDLGEMRTRFGWGEGASPALGGEILVVNWDHEDDSFIVALHARTGAELWRQPRDEPTSWATPLIVEHRGRTLAVVNATNRVRAYELETGRVVWACGGQTVNVIPSPVADDRAVYAMSGYRGAMLAAIPLDADGDLTGSGRLLWTRNRGTPYVPSPLLYQGRLYFTAGNTSLLTCLDARTGETVFGPERLPELSNVYASPVAAAGRVYVPSREGVTTVLAAGPPWQVLATNRLEEGFDASPALAGTQMFLRGRRHLYCLEE